MIKFSKLQKQTYCKITNLLKQVVEFEFKFK